MYTILSTLKLPRNNLDLLFMNSASGKVKLIYELGIYENRSSGMSSNLSLNKTACNTKQDLQP